MAVFKTLRQKSTEYVFKVFGNEKNEDPAKVVFARFPLSSETFPKASQKSIMNSSLVKNFTNTQEDKEKLVEYIIDIMVNNITANEFNPERFLKECVDHFENLVYEEKEIKTVKDFLALPEEAVLKISKDIYAYAKTEDEFTLLEKKISK
jgi:hypothetical protein